MLWPAKLVWLVKWLYISEIWGGWVSTICASNISVPWIPVKLGGVRFTSLGGSCADCIHISGDLFRSACSSVLLNWGELYSGLSCTRIDGMLIPPLFQKDKEKKYTHSRYGKRNWIGRRSCSSSAIIFRFSPQFPFRHPRCRNVSTEKK